ncbi:MAG: Fic family protein [Deltaproteobacteria bacterium]|jgi:Fic family protein|nr:Fic family protein [Deltaproteobacteria bacterium]
MNISQPKFQITNSMTCNIAAIERVRGFFEAVDLNSEWIKIYSQKALSKEAHHTTHIEGTQLTWQQADAIWNGKQLEDADQEDVRELLNYRTAFEYVSKHIDNENPVTEKFIRKIHYKLVDKVRSGKAAPGIYRKIPNYVINSTTKKVIYTPPPAQKIPDMMSQLVKWLNYEENIHPLLISGIAQFWLVHIHPFLDGNGRTSRLLSTAVLYGSGYDFKRLFSLSEYYDRNRRNFYKSLQSVRENNLDMTLWLEYYLKGLNVQLNELKLFGEKMIRKDNLVRKYKLNERQNLALEYIINNGDLSITEYQNLCPQVNRRTLQRDLAKLTNKQIITEQGKTNNKIYLIKHLIPPQPGSGFYC